MERIGMTVEQKRSIKVSEVRMIDDGSMADNSAVTARHWHPRGRRGLSGARSRPLLPVKSTMAPRTNRYCNAWAAPTLVRN